MGTRCEGPLWDSLDLCDDIISESKVRKLDSDFVECVKRERFRLMNKILDDCDRAYEQKNISDPF